MRYQTCCRFIFFFLYHAKSHDKDTASAQALGTKIDELAADIATDEADLKAATEIRDKEAASFAAEEKELTTVIDMLQRAVAVLEKELGGASLMQVKSAGSLVDALAVMVKAESINSLDAAGIASFMQSSTSDDDDDMVAPMQQCTRAPAVASLTP